MNIPHFDEIDESVVYAIGRSLEDGGIDGLVDNLLYAFEENKDYGTSAKWYLDTIIQELQKRQAE